LPIRINTKVPILEVDSFFLNNNNDINKEFEYDNFIISKETIRAVLTNNMNLLSKIIDEPTPIYRPFIFRSADIQLTALDYAILNKNTGAILRILKCNLENNIELPVLMKSKVSIENIEREKIMKKNLFLE